VNHHISHYLSPRFSNDDDRSYYEKEINQRLDKEYELSINYDGPKGYSKGIISDCIGTAISCYKEAAKQGYSKALLYLGIRQTRKKNSKDSVCWLCQLALHTIFDFEEYDELELFEDDDEKAIASLHHQAEQGLSVAQTVLANLYHTGNGIPEDQQQAIFWFSKAAQQQDIVAQYRLGEIYFEQLDFETAQAYFQTVSQNSFTGGNYNELDMTRIQLLAKDKLTLLQKHFQEQEKQRKN
jgi:TPR repeat protein